MWSVLNHSYGSHPCLTFWVLKHVYEARVERPQFFLVYQSQEGQTKKCGFACTHPLRCVLGLRVLYKQNFWYILQDVWKIDSNKYTILYGRWIIQCLRMWTGEWINAKRLLVFRSPFSFPSECSPAVPAKGCFYKYLPENLRSAVLPHENWELQTRMWIVAARI